MQACAFHANEGEERRILNRGGGVPEGGSGYLWLHESAGGVVQRYVRPRTARQEHQDKSGRVWKHAKLEERRSCCFVLPTKWLLPPNNRRLDSRRAESGGRLPTLSFVLVGSEVLRGSGRCPLPPLLTTTLETPELNYLTTTY